MALFDDNLTFTLPDGRKASRFDWHPYTFVLHNEYGPCMNQLEWERSNGVVHDNGYGWIFSRKEPAHDEMVFVALELLFDKEPVGVELGEQRIQMLISKKVVAHVSVVQCLHRVSPGGFQLRHIPHVGGLEVTEIHINNTGPEPFRLLVHTWRKTIVR